MRNFPITLRTFTHLSHSFASARKYRFCYPFFLPFSYFHHLCLFIFLFLLLIIWVLLWQRMIQSYGQGVLVRVWPFIRGGGLTDGFFDKQCPGRVSPPRSPGALVCIFVERWSHTTKHRSRLTSLSSKDPNTKTFITKSKVT